MQAFKNLGIMTKLIISFAVSGLIMSGLGWMAIEGMGQLADRTTALHASNLTPIKLIGEMRARVNRVRNIVMNHLYTRSGSEMEEYNKSLETLVKDINDLEQEYRPLISSETEKKGYEQFHESWAAYNKVRDRVLELSNGYRKDEGFDLMRGDGAQTFLAVTQGLQIIADDNAKQAEEGYKQSQDLAETIRAKTIGFVVGGMILGLVLSWLLARLIARSLADVNQAVGKLAAGDLAARASLASKDEIGQLATAFNSMGQQLQAKVEQERKMAAEIKSIMDSIDRAQAAIEFNLDGTILTANQNFLSCVGYQLEEIKGKHHRMFADPAYAASPEYTAFWAKLSRGEFDAGVYRRLGKGGREIWIQASYNPILDANGKPYKVVKFATDITEQKNQAAEFEGKIAAVGKAQAAIEFNLDGTILTANQNFLSCVGYQLEEIKGKHHRMFADPAYAASPEYAAFWAKLSRGEFDAGVYRRLGKGGKEIWIQASYNPIMDANGKPYKVVKFATDITGQKQAQREVEQAQSEVERLIKAAAAGQLSERIKTEVFTGSSKELTEGFNRLLVSVETPIHEAQTVLTALAANDLTKQMAGTYEGEFEQMKISLNSALTNLSSTVTGVRDAVDAVFSGSEEITKGNESLSQRTSEQASALEETSASMEEMTSTVKQNADNAKQANQLAIAARETADKGGAVTRKAVDAMGEINKSSKKIADIITVIDEIAFQTNLLALNAAVEAARAGEHGRGFAVVAAEVRNLAQRSATAAKEIKELINESIQRVDDGSELVNLSGKTLEEIVNSVKRVTDIIAEISAASQEQAAGIDQVNKAIMSMDETTQQNAALVEETTAASQSMKDQARDLMQQVEVFKVVQSKGAERAATVVRGDIPRLVPKSSPIGAVQAEDHRVAGKASVAATKRMKDRASVVLAVGNGKDRRGAHDQFDEF